MYSIIEKVKNKLSPSMLIIIFVVLAAFLLGMFVGGDDEGRPPIAGTEDAGTTWTCSMHPQVQQPAPGQCPICGMDLIPVSSASGEKLGIREIKLSETAQKLANIQTAAVKRDFISKEIRMVGKVDYDETRLKYITAWVPGRIDRMFVDYTGTKVRRGDHLVQLYSPDLISTQQELLQSLRSAESSGSEMMQRNVQAVQERLRLWGLTQNQINQIINTGEIPDKITIYAPFSGIVIHKDGFEGMYVQTGTRMYTLADLSHLWVKLDAYESDVPWIRYGQEVEFFSTTYPGEKFSGRISFIDPVLNEKSRTVKIRVNVDNMDGKLKPGMFVSATVTSKIASGGIMVMDSNLKGKWISPMHPEIIKDRPGSCDVCGMDLVPVKELGYVSEDKLTTEASLLIPASAPLITGKRAVVYVQVPGKEGVFEGREVVLGPRAGGYYVVLEGLAEGEIVVTNGNFKIDSAIQIMAKPSMMNPKGGVTSVGHDHGTSGKVPQEQPKSVQETKIPAQFVSQLEELYATYFSTQNALSHDKLEEAGAHAGKILGKLKQVAMELVKGDLHLKWMQNKQDIENAAVNLRDAEDLMSARSAFFLLSNSIIETVKVFGSREETIYLYHCPMAFENKGADWMQNKQGTENPYFGSQMFSCGSQTEILSTAGESNEGAHDHD